MSSKKDLTGQRFGRLTVLEDSGKRNLNGDVRWLCLCDCGNIKSETGSNLKYRTRSCGCLQKERRIKHGHNHRGKTTKLYRTWMNMKNRCVNPNIPGFKYWGGKGISVCQEWKNDFITFMKWALSHGYKPGLAIARIDSNKGYCPENCRFKTRSENAREAGKKGLGWRKAYQGKNV